MLHISENARSRVNRLHNMMIRMPEICPERSRYLTESYRMTEGEPEVIRRAKALDYILSNMTIFIANDEYLVGRTNSKLRGGVLTPEQNSSWYSNDLESFSTREVDRFAPIPEEVKKQIRSDMDYWKDKSVFDKWKKGLPKDCFELDGILIGGTAFCANNQYYGHSSPDFEMFIRKGANGLMAEIDRKLESLEMSDLCSLGRRNQYEAMKLTLIACIKYAERYAVLAEGMAERESDPGRATELKTIAAVCRRVPAMPAATFYEAAQSACFAYVLTMIEEPGPGIGFLRADQYLFPYYEADLAAGRTGHDEAYLVAASLYAKCNETILPYNLMTAKVFAGFSTDSNITLGGVKPDGSCAVSELSYLFLEAEQDISLNAEDIIIRGSADMPKEFLMQACKAAKKMSGKLKFLGDDVVIRQLESIGFPPEMARDYAITGCNTPTVPGQSLDTPGGVINVPLIFELALNNGISRMTGRKLGISTGDPSTFASYGEVWDAFCSQARYLLPRCQLMKNLDKRLQAEFLPGPFLSTMFEACIEKGQDIVRGATFPHITFGQSLGGTINVGDALLAIRKLVFEENRFTMAQLIQALDRNFEGYPELLHLISRIPKYGNNDDEADDSVNDVLEMLSGIARDVPGYGGSLATVAAAAITSNVPQGSLVGALPDGRRAGEAYADGGLSPHHGRNISGPTSTMLSAAKMNHMALLNGSVLNMRFDPDALKGDSKIDKFASMIRIFFQSGGFLVQFNIVSTDTLRAAQREPEKYSDLLVRVATYSARFVELGAAFQEDIINRMEFSGL